MQETSPIIEVKNLGKKYSITHMRGKYIALRDVLTTIIRNPFKFTKTKVQQAAGLDKKEDFWALRDVNFNVSAGEIVGVIGANGAGKSTLLKILTGITPPTEGEVILHGRVSSLLEVGTGFHPELTGRENIFLNGAILGMTRREIAVKFDEIVAFAGVEKFLDTPVKYYSSGMYVRLAFSVAAHMEPDILLVDEVLAVGDAEFQKKCLGKMEEVTKTSGRTILFVSHNMGAIQNLCKTCILLEKGRVRKVGPTKEVIDYYLNKSEFGTAVTSFKDMPRAEVKGLKIRQVSILNDKREPSTILPVSEPFSIEIEFAVTEKIEKATVTLAVYKEGELLLYSSGSDKDARLEDFEPGRYVTRIAVPAFLFNVGGYFFDVIIHKPMVLGLDHVPNLYFEISDVNNPRSTIMAGESRGKIASILPQTTSKLD